MNFITDNTHKRTIDFVRKTCEDFANDFHADISAILGTDNFDITIEPQYIERTYAPYLDNGYVPARCVDIFMTVERKDGTDNNNGEINLSTSIYFDAMKMPYEPSAFNDESEWLRCRIYEGLHDNLVIEKVKQAAQDRNRSRVLSDMRRSIPSISPTLYEMNEKGVFSFTIPVHDD